MIQKGLIFILTILTCGIYADWQNDDYFQEKFERLISTHWDQPTFKQSLSLNSRSEKEESQPKHKNLDQSDDPTSIEEDQIPSASDHLTNSVVQLSSNYDKVLNKKEQNFDGDKMKKKRRKRKKVNEDKVDQDLHPTKPLDPEPEHKYDNQGLRDLESIMGDNFYEYYHDDDEWIKNKDEQNKKKKEDALSWAIRMGLKATELQIRRRMGLDVGNLDKILDVILDGGKRRQDDPPGIEFLGAGVSYQELLEEALAKGLETIAFVVTDVLMTVGWPDE